MAIKGKEGILDRLKVQQAPADASAVARRKAENAKDNIEEESDKVSIANATAINKELDPLILVAERREKVEKLKQQYLAGTLESPSSDELASAVAEALDEEVSDLRILFGDDE